jgi:hypothetical protein
MPGLSMRPVESGHRARATADLITADVRDTLDEAFTDAPGERLEVGPFQLDSNGQPEEVPNAFDSDGKLVNKGTKEAAEEWLWLARSHAMIRQPRTYVFAGNPTKDGMVRFTVTAHSS